MSLGLLHPSSNCVINLAPDKRAVLREAYRVLKVMPGPAPAAGAKQGWSGPAIGVLVGCRERDSTRLGCRMGPGDTSAEGPEQGSIGGCPFSLYLLSCCFSGSPFTPRCLPAWGRDVLQ